MDCAGNAHRVGGKGYRLMFYQVYAAVCLATTVPKDGDIHNALDWIAAPNRSSGPARA